jgi:23S rRNA A2030 N6-methylase RlmJ
MKKTRASVHLGEGWHIPRALLPVQEKRAIMLIDPPFEQADELKRCTVAMKERSAACARPSRRSGTRSRTSAR